MIHSLFGTLFLFLFYLQTAAQTDPNIVDFSTPENVVEAIFRAAKGGTFEMLSNLCDPLGEGDGDTKQICSVPQLAEQAEASSPSDDLKNSLEEFVAVFKEAEITGNTTYSTHQGTNYAHVPFRFNHPGGVERSEETMILVEREKKWYLYSF
jgi:hypothetical protein